MSRHSPVTQSPRGAALTCAARAPSSGISGKFMFMQLPVRRAPQGPRLGVFASCRARWPLGLLCRTGRNSTAAEWYSHLLPSVYGSDTRTVEQDGPVCVERAMDATHLLQESQTTPPSRDSCDIVLISVQYWGLNSEPHAS
jgi:hypothetical protein